MTSAPNLATPAPANPTAMDGIEFVEFATHDPDSFGDVLRKLGFSAIAQHRSRQVYLYRQGVLNLIVNADQDTLDGLDLTPDQVILNAVAFRVADAGRAYKTLVDWGAWPIQTRASTMELNIPGIHGIGDSILYLVDRYQDFSIYDVDFQYNHSSRYPPEIINGCHFFGLVHYVGIDRLNAWIDFYRQLFGFTVLPSGHSFGILPKGVLLQSPCRSFYLQLIPPDENAIWDLQWEERFARLAFGVPDIKAAVRLLEGRGVGFEERESIHVTEKGALTQNLYGGMNFELVRSHRDASQS